MDTKNLKNSYPNTSYPACAGDLLFTYTKTAILAWLSQPDFENFPIFQSTLNSEGSKHDTRHDVTGMAALLSPDQATTLLANELSTADGHVMTNKKFASPFSTSPWITSKHAKIWYYIDESCITRGPYSSVQMDHWFTEGYLFNEIFITFDPQQSRFTMLVDYIKKSETAKRKLQQQKEQKKRHNRPVRTPLKIHTIMEEKDEDDEEEDSLINSATLTNETSENGDKDQHSPSIKSPTNQLQANNEEVQVLKSNELPLIN